MLRIIRNSRITKIISLITIIVFINDIINPINLFALTGGPSQPEVQSFQPVGTSDMVDLFTGDFSYNIPLLDVGGYPVNLFYQSGVTMDQEASWVGLGWNINPGSIVRNVRALPDDFNGEHIIKETNMKENLTFGANVTLDAELFGIELGRFGLEAGVGLSYNNYRGYSFEFLGDVSFASGEKNFSYLNAGLGISASSDGVDIQPNLSYSKTFYDNYYRDTKLTGRIGIPYNSRSGVKALNMSADIRQTFAARKLPRNTYTARGTGVSGSLNGGSRLSYAAPSYIPEVFYSMLNTSVSINATVGGEIFGTHPKGKLSGYFSGQFMVGKKVKVPAYGYLYSHNSQKVENALMDFNREKDGAFTENRPALPIPVFTYDIYMVNGQGVGGMYRPHRGDIGILRDYHSSSASAGTDISGIELGFGNAVHAGANISVNSSISYFGNWESDNLLTDTYKFKGFGQGTDHTYEPWYFKQAGEKTAESDAGFIDKFGQDKTVKVKLNTTDKDVKAVKELVEDNLYGDIIGLNDHMTRDKRKRRNQDIMVLTAIEARDNALIPEIEDYAINNFSIDENGNYDVKETSSRITSHGRSAKHISEITVTRDDGSRYIYGIPVYNYKQKEVTFAINDDTQTKDEQRALITYTPGEDNSVKNKNGKDNYYNSSELPPYATSYLLTAVLSHDYVDVTGDGPTDDDLGTYTRINYTRAGIKPENDNLYGWRIPFEHNTANHNEGFKSYNYEDGDFIGDDKANYIYGEKEIWYVHSIVTKTHMAEFHLAEEERKDSRGIVDENGGTDDLARLKLQKLDRIDLYTKADKLANKETATPIKSVHFEYYKNDDINSLCKKAPNNTNITSGGKLTLKKVYFTYRNSKKGMLSPYQFEYAQFINNEGNPIDANFPYHLKGYDRWGNYKKPEIGLPNWEYPYTNQEYDETNECYLADLYATAWNLTTIKLPSGGIINVEYEADDYAYVQDKRAMQMVKVVETASGSSLSPPESLSSNKLLYDGSVNYTYLIFEADNSYTNADKFRRDYFCDDQGKSMELLYFKFFIDMEGGKYEYVPGYVEIDYDKCGYFSDGGQNYGYVKIQEVNLMRNSSASFNPISRAAFNHMKLYLPEIAFGTDSDPSKGDILQILDAMKSAIKSIGEMIFGFNRVKRLASCAQIFNSDKSWIRLYNPKNAKKGGGARVKKVILNDQWAIMDAAGENKIYGQEYSYTTTNNHGDSISSGVAAYEPLLGGDENPFRMPVSYTTDNFLAIDDEYYLEKPFGESFFPGPSVGYSKITVTGIKPTDKTVSGTGHTVHEFYTAKDFPTHTWQSKVNPDRKKPNIALGLLKINNYDYLSASQGYCIELNDMHGKPKANWVYPENKSSYISGVQYRYRIDEKGGLDNKVLAMDANNELGMQTIGVDYDFYVDMREHRTKNESFGVYGNVDGFMAAIIPIAIPIVLPTVSTEEVRTRTAVANKVVHRYGLLDTVITYDLGATDTLVNYVYDAETGQVLLTKTNNDFNNHYYNFNMPAHWVYDGMAQAYKNSGIVLFGQKVGIRKNIGNGEEDIAGAINNELINNILVEGDEIRMYHVEETSNYLIGYYGRAWVIKVEKGVAYLFHENGIRVHNGKYNLKILRSGRRNRPSFSIASVTSKDNPVIKDGYIYTFKLDNNINILSAGAQEFTEEAKLFCKGGITTCTVYNIYKAGLRGNWRPFRSWTTLKTRGQGIGNDMDIRNDGVMENYAPFWEFDGEWKIATNNEAHWTKVNEVTIYSNQGAEIENEDALGINSSAIYSYNQTLPKALVHNARFKEIGNESFEDFVINNYSSTDKDPHAINYGDISQDAFITKEDAHTGKQSLLVPAGGKVTLNKNVK